ncbi:unnamed protein product [Penicillium olsonii]|nr:unnamed protein product [Penicillium olsonii]
MAAVHEHVDIPSGLEIVSGLFHNMSRNNTDRPAARDSQSIHHALQLEDMMRENLRSNVRSLFLHRAVGNVNSEVSDAIDSLALAPWSIF